MLKNILINLIQIYKKFISPILPSSCRFYPSCSEYAIGAFENFGFWKALMLIIVRISKCNPIFEGYENQLPIKKEKL